MLTQMGFRAAEAANNTMAGHPLDVRGEGEGGNPDKEMELVKSLSESGFESIK